MVRKAFRTGNSIVVSLPPDAVDYLHIQAGTEIEVNLDRENRQVIIKPLKPPASIPGVDEEFAQQLAEFIEQYRPALVKLAK